MAPLVLAVTAFVFAGPAAAIADTAPTGSIRGLISASNGALQVAAGEVSVSYEFSSDNATWTPQPTTTTSTASSIYNLRGLAAGYYRLTFTDTVHPALQPYVATAALATDQSTVRLDAVLNGASTITGTVQVNDRTNANPRAAAAGEVQVTLYSLIDGTLGATGMEPRVLTDATGGFSFPGIDTADYTYTLLFTYKGSDGGHVAGFWDDAGSTGLVPIAPRGASVPPLVYTVTYANGIEGTVLDSASKPIAGVPVCVTFELTAKPFDCTQSPNATTDSAGHYVVTNLGNATWALEFGPAAGYSGQIWKGANTFSTPTLIPLAGHGIVSGFDATLLRDDTISASLSVQGLSASQAAAVGTGAVDVQQLDATTNTWVDSGRWHTTDAAGHFTISSLLPGTYRVDFRYTDAHGTVVHKVSDPVTFDGEGKTAALSASLYQPIRPGTTVKTSASATVYLVDGSTILVPVDSMTTLSDLGFSTKPVVYDATRLSSYTVSAHHLSNAVTCLDGQTWMGAEGRLNYVGFDTAGLAKTAPGITALDDTTCTILPKSTLTYGAPPAISVHGSPTVYVIGPDGKKHAYLNGTDFRLEGGQSPVVFWVSSYYLNRIATGSVRIPPGRLVKTTTSSSIYVADGPSRLLPLTSFAVATDAGLSTQYDTVAASQLSDYTVAKTPFPNVFVCLDQTFVAGGGHSYVVTPSLVAALPKLTLDVGTCDVMHVWNTGEVIFKRALFVKSASSSTIYSVNAAGQKQRVFSMGTVAAMMAPDPARYVTVNDGFLASMPLGTDLVTAGLLVKSPTSTSIYVADGAGGLLPLRSFTTATDLGLSTHYVTTTAATMASLTVRPAALNNLVTCSGTTWIGGAGKLWSVDASVPGSLPVSALPASLCAVLPKSASALGTAVFLKSSTSATVYTLEAGVKHPVSAWATLVRLAAGKPVTVLSVDAGFVSRIPTGAVRR